jgi:hypothetical protein
MAQRNDWRLTNQLRYLRGVTLHLQSYVPASPANDHDHCEFCWAKFMTTDEPAILRSGYTTSDRYRWICEACFVDFREQFEWQVVT